jgi:hypothetical protein
MRRGPKQNAMSPFSIFPCFFFFCRLSPPSSTVPIDPIFSLLHPQSGYIVLKSRAGHRRELSDGFPSLLPHRHLQCRAFYGHTWDKKLQPPNYPKATRILECHECRRRSPGLRYSRLARSFGIKRRWLQRLSRSSGQRHCLPGHQAAPAQPPERRGATRPKSWEWQRQGGPSANLLERLIGLIRK